jgi:hypothetical protein
LLCGYLKVLDPSITTKELNKIVVDIILPREPEPALKVTEDILLYFAFPSTRKLFMAFPGNGN